MNSFVIACECGFKRGYNSFSHTAQPHTSPTQLNHTPHPHSSATQHSAWLSTVPGSAQCLVQHSAWLSTVPGSAQCLAQHSAWFSECSADRTVRVLGPGLRRLHKPGPKASGHKKGKKLLFGSSNQILCLFLTISKLHLKLSMTLNRDSLTCTVLVYDVKYKLKQHLRSHEIELLLGVLTHACRHIETQL